MPKLTTSEAFKEMINLRAIHRELEVSSNLTRQWRKQVNDNPDNPKAWGISTDKMEQMLTKFGYTVAQEKLWMK